MTGEENSAPASTAAPASQTADRCDMTRAPNTPLIRLAASFLPTSRQSQASMPTATAISRVANSGICAPFDHNTWFARAR